MHLNRFVAIQKSNFSLTHNRYHYRVRMVRGQFADLVQIVDEAIRIGHQIFWPHFDVHSHHRLAEDFLEKRKNKYAE